VIAAVVVRLPFLERPVALPVGFALVHKGTDAASRLALGRRLVEALVAPVAGRTVHVLADSAYAGRALRDLPASITWTTRLRVNAALSALAPPRTGKRGRPPLKGERLAAPKTLASTTTFAPTSVHRYGATMQAQTAVIACLWYRGFGPQQVQVVPVRDGSTDGYDVALVSTDLTATAGQVVERYAARWSIEVAIEDAKQTTGVGQARNRVRPAVQRTVPFGLVMSTVAICWYATRRLPPPGRPGRTHPSTLVPRQGPTLGRRHAHQTPTRDHHRPIAANRPPTGHPRGNQHPTAGLGGHRRIDAKVERPGH